jgi:hypothetical protein
MLLGAAACGGGADPEPAPDTQTLVSGEYTVEPGQERYLCHSFRSPDELVAIVEIAQVVHPAVHHVVLVQAVRGEDPEGMYECPEIFRTNWDPIWASGTGGNGFVLPEGVGFVIDPRTQYVVQLHLQNTTDAPITGTSALELTYARDPAVVEPAGIFVVGTLEFSIPPGAADYSAGMECMAPFDMQAFAAFPHMHKLGKRLELYQGPGKADAQMMYVIDPWPFDDQPFDAVSETIPAGSYLGTTCHWSNPTGRRVEFGESSDDEMCFMLMFYYPAWGNSLLDSIDCIGY